MSSKAALISGGETAMVPKLRFPEFRAAGVWKPISLKNASTPVIEQVGQRMLTPVSISAGIGFVRQSEKFGRDISGNQYQLYTLVRDGDFVFNKGNSLKFPQGCIYLLDGWGEVAAPNVFICFRLKDGYSNAFFQNCFEQNQHGRQLQKDITSGARSNGLLNISKETFFGVEILTPSLSEQQKIADCLTSADELIATQAEKVEALKAHKKGMMQQLFPRPERTENGQKIPPETKPRLRIPEFEGAGDWETAPLSQLASYENGKAYEQDIVDAGKYVVVNSRFISTDGMVQKFSNANYLTAQANDVLMVLSDLPKGRALAKCYFVEADEKYGVNQRVCRLKTKGMNPRFLYLILNRNPYLLSFDDGQNQTHLSKGNVLDCPLWFPKELKEQQRIADSLTSLDDLIAAESIKLDTLKTHKKALMQQLFPSPKGAET
ncbi:restriction endonuclease subunit S [Aquidulcibacter sp.]|jgi:type I restriction enzyme S subunit|uniref:restriction endonuclease subunit S n=1 Tax=Aquidulcibacter sp. TaxID=2052990 RepID=UPI0037BFF276